MSFEVELPAKARDISRLCHFTPARNLFPLFRTGLLSASSLLEDDVRAVYNPTDLERLDGFKGHVCCSIEYPNAWYLRKARGRSSNFADWVILLIDPSLLWSEDVGYCPRNAAAGYGSSVSFDKSGFESMYAPSVLGAYNRQYIRSPKHIRSAPTDNQAEVLIPGSVPMTRVHGIACRSEDQARTEYHRLKMLGMNVDAIRFVVAADLFDPYSLKSAIESGRPPTEWEWTEEVSL